MAGGTADTAVLTVGGGDGSLTTGDRAGSISFKADDASYKNTFSDGIAGEIACVTASSTGAAYALAFYTGTITGSNRGERMRIGSSGNLLLGTTSIINTGVFSVEFTGASENGISLKTSTSSNGSKFLSFANSGGTEIGYVSEDSNTSVSYSTSSDQRLKENISDADDAGAKIDSIQVRKYDWKVDGSHQDYGMIAQELQVVAPEAVSGDPESDEMMGVDYSKLVPMMLKEIQSLRARIAALES
jgi:hypothetical protein